MSLIERDFMRRGAKRSADGADAAGADAAGTDAEAPTAAHRAFGRPVGRPNLDPVLAAVIAGVVVVGGGLGVYGLTAGGDPTPASAAAVAPRPADAATRRALAAVDATTARAADAPTAAEARRAAALGRTRDPFTGAMRSAAAGAAGSPSTGAATPVSASGAGATSSAGGSGAGASGSTAGSGAPHSWAGSIAQKARNAVATADVSSGAAANASADGPGASGGAGGSGAGTSGAGAAPGAPATHGGSSSARPGTGGSSAGTPGATRPAPSWTKHARVSVRVATPEGRRSRSRMKLGRALPSGHGVQARLRSVSADGRVVHLTLSDGVRFARVRQSPGTRCVRRTRTRSHRCLIARVRTGKTVVLRSPSRHGEPGQVWAVRMLGVWRGDHRVAGL